MSDEKNIKSNQDDKMQPKERGREELSKDINDWNNKVYIYEEKSEVAIYYWKIGFVRVFIPQKTKEWLASDVYLEFWLWNIKHKTELVPIRWYKSEINRFWISILFREILSLDSSYPLYKKSTRELLSDKLPALTITLLPEDLKNNKKFISEQEVKMIQHIKHLLRKMLWSSFLCHWTDIATMKETIRESNLQSLLIQNF